MRQQLPFIATGQDFAITTAIREKLMAINPATIDRALKRQGCPRPEGEKPYQAPREFLKHRISIQTFYISEERNLPGFI
ncbi:MAG: hypothetical protein LBD79_03730 [Treponema sp.]|jgi:hypothetical protein|nr:hypothetical protein [Treponema sp.]